MSPCKEKMVVDRFNKLTAQDGDNETKRIRKNCKRTNSYHGNPMHAKTFQWVQSNTLYPRICNFQRSSKFCCRRITIVNQQVFAYKEHMLVHSLHRILHSYTIGHFLCDMRNCPIEKLIERDNSKVAVNVTTGKQSIVRSPLPPPTHAHPPPPTPL